jgi:hypothetical protein
MPPFDSRTSAESETQPMTDDDRTIAQVAEDEDWRQLGVLARERRRSAYYADRGLDDPTHAEAKRRIARLYRET